MKLVVATNNQHKLEEFRRILSPLGVQVLSQSDVHVHVEPEETGTTFAENAKIKAKAVFDVCGLPSVADDSGLCVDALDGRPGVYSARYLGEDTPYEQKNAALLAELKDVPEEERGAQFVSGICCQLDEEHTIETVGICEGTIGWEPRGQGGFGYDPIFMVDGKSYSELTGEEKDAVSHRGRALRQFYTMLEEYLNKHSDTEER